MSAAGEAIEALFKDRIDDHLAELAHHYSRSANTRKAVEYLFRAGSQAVAPFRFLRSGHPAFQCFGVPQASARRHRTGAHRSWQCNPVLAPSHWRGKRLGGAGTGACVCDERASCARKSATRPSPSLSLFEQWLTRWWKLELHEGYGARRRASGHGRGRERPNDAPVRRTGRAALSCFELGDLVSANEHLEKSLAVFDLRQPLPDPQVELRRVGFARPPVLWPVPTWLSRSCLGEIARDAGGGSAVFHSSNFGCGFLPCGAIQLAPWGRLSRAKARRRGDSARRSDSDSRSSFGH